MFESEHLMRLFRQERNDDHWHDVAVDLAGLAPSLASGVSDRFRLAVRLDLGDQDERLAGGMEFGNEVRPYAALAPCVPVKKSRQSGRARKRAATTAPGGRGARLTSRFLSSQR